MTITTSLTGWVGPHAFFIDKSEIAMGLLMKLAQLLSAGFQTRFGIGVEENEYDGNTMANHRSNNWIRWVFSSDRL